jgi:hypothetical protein
VTYTYQVLQSVTGQLAGTFSSISHITKSTWNIVQDTSGLHDDWFQLLGDSLSMIESMLNYLIQQLDATRHVNNNLLTTYHALHEEKAPLRTEIHQLRHAVIHLAILPPPPPSPNTTIDTSSAMKEMSLLLYGAQQDLQDMLHVVCHPAGK